MTQVATTIYVINGPNLNLLGERDPAIYGTETLLDIEAMLRTLAERLGVHVTFFQSNHEGTLIDILHEARHNAAGVILNPGGYTHTSVALRDAVEAIAIPVVEVHLSDIHAREEFRRKSMIADVCRQSIVGQGAKGYELALEYLATQLAG